MQFIFRRRSSCLLAAWLLISAAGCSGNGVSTSTQPSKDNKPNELEVVQIKPVNLDGYNQTIEQFKGKVIVVDWWFFT